MIKLNEKTFDRDVHLIDEDEFQVCKVNNMSVIDMKSLDRLVVDPNLIGKIDASYNYINHLDPVLLKFVSLLYLDMNMNHIKVLKNLHNCVMLLELNLSFNKLEEIDDLHYLPDLRKLNVS